MAIELTKGEALAIVNILQRTEIKAVSIKEMRMFVHGYEKMLAGVPVGEDPEPAAAEMPESRHEEGDPGELTDKAESTDVAGPTTEHEPDAECEPTFEPDPASESEPAAAAGKKKRTDKRTPKNIDHGKVKALRDAGWKLKDIANEVGCSTNGVRQILLRFQEEEEKEALAEELRKLQK